MRTKAAISPPAASPAVRAPLLMEHQVSTAQVPALFSEWSARAVKTADQNKRTPTATSAAAAKTETGPPAWA